MPFFGQVLHEEFFAYGYCVFVKFQNCIFEFQQCVFFLLYGLRIFFLEHHDLPLQNDVEFIRNVPGPDERLSSLALLVNHVGAELFHNLGGLHELWLL